MSTKYKSGDLEGTLKKDFEIGKGNQYGFRRDETTGQMKVRDPEVGEHPLSDFLGGGGGSADFDLLIITDEGGLVYDDAGEIVLKETS